MPRRPLDGPRRITGNTATHAVYGVGPATDYGADYGETCRAPFAGTIARWWSTTGGNSLSVTSLLWRWTGQHFSAYLGSGGKASEGDPIAAIGSTGTATTGPHLHNFIVNRITGKRYSVEEWLVKYHGFTTAALYGTVSGHNKTSTAGTPGTVIPNETPTRKKNNMTSLYHKEGTNPALYALAGDSPGTPANWLETTGYESLAVPWARNHGNAITLAGSTFEAFKSRYLAQISIAAALEIGDIEVTPIADPAILAALEQIVQAVQNSQSTPVDAAGVVSAIKEQWSK